MSISLIWLFMNILFISHVYEKTYWATPIEEPLRRAVLLPRRWPGGVGYGLYQPTYEKVKKKGQLFSSILLVKSYHFTRFRHFLKM